MGHRGRSLRSDMEMTSTQNGGGKSSSHLSTTVAGHPARHFRQFTTRSRTKSAASFRSLHRVLSHESTEGDCHSVAANSFTKSRSSDSLYRKRAISGLNMTMLARVRSNPGHIPRSRSGSMASTHSLGAGFTRLKPSRSKSTHLVIDSHEGDELYEDDTTTDEEVEYFTDEEDEVSNKGNKSSASDESSQKDEIEGPKLHSKSKEPMLLSKTFSNLTVPLEESETNEGIGNQPSYQVPSNMIAEPHHEGVETSQQEGNGLRGLPSHTTLQDDVTMQDQINSHENNVPNDGDDHISNSNLNVYDTETLSAHSLKRQGRECEFNEMGEDEERNTVEAVPHQDPPFEVQDRNSDIEQYMPSMILSQSTGAVRRFEQPPSIQNSLSNNYHNGSIEEDDGNGDQIDSNGNYPRTHEEEPKVSAASANITQHYSVNAPQASNQQNFSSSISGLTNSLLKTAPDSFHGTSRMSHLMRKRTSQNNLMRSDPRQAYGTELPASPLHRENAASVSSINNFAQFLKSDAMDGESRTQRKLWLQRENSIMDLSAHNDGNDPIFMASNIEVKREFERISHEYSNVRRFTNPVEEAMARVESDQKSVGIKSSNKSNQDLGNSLFSGYNSRSKEEFLPKPHDAKLHRILSSIWKEETAQFNKDTNPLSRLKSNGTGHHFPQPSRNSLRSGAGSGTALQHQRTINSLQPTTRAVNRRIENAIHHQQRL